MKTRAVRIAAAAVALGALFAAPAAATPSLELPGAPGAPVASQPGGGVITPQASFCHAAPWWPWCR